MADTSLSAVVRHLRQIASPSADPRDDHELLDAFVARHDQAAFAVLVRRHGPMVLNVCRHVLRHEQDAEDAFQAAFLVLATKAASISIRTSVAGFLHGIAYRLALKTRREAARRRRREACVQTATIPDAAAELNWREVQAVLEEEVQRLPEKYRLPFVLCHLEGLSRAEAGRQLGLKEGTIWSRLSQARARLQQRLARRGIALSAALGAMAVAETPVRAELCEVVVRAARQGAMGPAVGAVSARVALLTQAGLQMMTGKMKLALLGVVMLLAAGVGGVGYQALTAEAPETPAATIPQAKAAPEAKKPEAPRVRSDRHGDPLPDGAIARLGTVRWRHGFLIQGMTYSPDGKMIAAVGAGRAITLWDAATGKEIRQFPNHDQPSYVAFSPDGKILATGGLNYLAHLWDIATGKELRQIGAGCFAFSPDGKLVTTAKYDGKAQRWDADNVRIWDVNTGKVLRSLDCKQGDLSAVAYSPDGKLLAVAGTDGTISLRDPATGGERRRLTQHKKAIGSMVFSPDGKQLASSSNDGTVRLWDVATGRQSRILAEKLGEYDYKPIAFSPDGILLALGYSDGTIRIWDVASGAEKRHWKAAAISVMAIAFSPDGKALASGGAWGSIRLWDVATGNERYPSDEHRGFVKFLRFSPDGSSLTSIGLDKRLIRWDLATRKPLRFLERTDPGAFYGIALSPDGTTLAAADPHSQELRLWDTRTSKSRRSLAKAKQMIVALAFSPDGRLVAYGEKDHAIHILDVRDGRKIREIKGVTSGTMSLCFSPDSKSLACGIWAQGKRTLRMWEVDSGKEKIEFSCFDTFVGPVAFSPDGKVLAAAGNQSNISGESFVRLWDTATGKERSNHAGHREPIGAIAFSPDGKLVASGTGDTGRRDNSVHVWEAATGRLIRRFEGHHSCVISVAFSPDGLTVASGAGDSTILLWDITGRRNDGRWHVKPLTQHELDVCWNDLANADAARAYDTVWSLVAAPEQAVPFLRQKMPPMPRPDARHIAKMIANLDNDDFTVREKAMDELRKLGEAAALDLRRALETKPSAEVRRRIQQLLDQPREWPAERLRVHRAIQALEHIGTQSAREALQALAAGVPGAFRTEQAKAALQRMAR